MSNAELLAGRFAMGNRRFVEGPIAALDADDRVRGERVLVLDIPRAGVPEDVHEALHGQMRSALQVRHAVQLAAYGASTTTNTLLVSFERPGGDNLAMRSKAGSTRGLPWSAVRRAALALIDGAVEARDAGEPFLVSRKQVWIRKDGSVRVLPFWPTALPGVGEDLSATGSGDVAEQYRVATVVYELVVGHPPSGRVARLNRSHPDVPKGAAKALERAMHASPAKRLASLEKLRAALGPTVGPTPGRKRSRGPWYLVGLAALASAVTLLAPASLAWVREQAAPSEPSAAARLPEASTRGPRVPAEAAARWSGRFEEAGGHDGARLRILPNGRFELHETKVVRRGRWAVAGDGIELAVERDETGDVLQAQQHKGGLLLAHGEKTRTFLCTRLEGAPLPLLALHRPPEGALIGEDTVGVVGRIAQAGGRVLINGLEVTADDHGRFATDAPLMREGETRIHVVYEAPNGFEAHAVRQIRVDRRSPRLEAQASGRRVDGQWQITVSGKVRDESPPVRVRVDGSEVDVDENGNFHLVREGDPYRSEVIQVHARDDAGHETTQVVRTGALSVVKSTAVALARAESAGKRGDWGAVERILADARREGLTTDVIPAWLVQGLTKRAVSLSVRIEHPRPASILDGPGIEVRARVLGLAPGDTVEIDGVAAIGQGSRFERALRYDDFGTKTVLVRVLRGGVARASSSVEFKVRDRNPRIRAWAKGHLDVAQEELAERLGIPVAFENHLGMRFILIPPGAYVMGPDGIGPGGQRRREVKRPVRFTRPFYMQMHEVTNEQVRRFAPLAKHYIDGDGGQSLSGRPQPAAGLVVDEMEAFSAWVQKTDKTPGRRYMLPTDAEWEYAARAGSTNTWFYWRGGAKKFASYANLSDDSARRLFDKGGSDEGWSENFRGDDGFAVAAPVGSLEPNAWGLFDMIGNVAEVCRDHPEPYKASQNPLTDPVGRLDTGIRSLRGGSWNHRRGGAGLAWRGTHSAVRRKNYVGFRLIVPVQK